MKIVTAIIVLILLTDILHADITVCNDCEINSISKAVEIAEPGSTIYVRQGTYHESLILIKKSLSLIGIDNPVIIAKNGDQVFTLSGDNITIKGFTIKNVEKSYVEDRAAIKSIKSSNITIEGNTLINTFFGIYFANTQNSRIRNNIVHGNAKEQNSSANAIHVWYCDSLVIENNETFGHRDGIYLEFVNHSRIENNYSKSNLRYGLHFMFSDNDKYYHNTFENNGAGVAVMYSNQIEMMSNKFIKNWGASSYGLLLKEIKDSRIERNYFFENTIGIYAESAIRCDILHNDFESNGWALKLLGSCEQNTISKNNFVSNTFELATNKNARNYNTYEYNFWSAYSGYDLNKDGIGDVPHKPIELFSTIISDSPHAIILIRSIFVDMMNLAEKIIPVLTPENLSDPKPLMKRIKHDKVLQY